MKANYKMPVVTLASVILGALAMMLSVIATALAQIQFVCAELSNVSMARPIWLRHAMAPS
jgi:hypothetical protein